MRLEQEVVIGIKQNEIGLGFCGQAELLLARVKRDLLPRQGAVGNQSDRDLQCIEGVPSSVSCSCRSLSNASDLTGSQLQAKSSTGCPGR